MFYKETFIIPNSKLFINTIVTLDKIIFTNYLLLFGCGGFINLITGLVRSNRWKFNIYFNSYYGLI